ncbi:MAG: GAF domain-containing protein [Planctomycetes bacterium]|nr:GAF domain-containing protein [Planctomycetota bacterium]
MNDPEKPFVPVGLPRHAQPSDAAEHRVGLHLLEALDSLDTVYGSAAFFAGVAAEEAIGDFALDRCLESVGRDCGAIGLVEDGRMQWHAERNGACGLLRADILTTDAVAGRAMFYNDADARKLLRPAVADHNVLTCPIQVGSKRLGLLIVVAPAGRLFSTADCKLVAAVTSQAAIALSRAEHHRQVEIERRKLEQVIQNHSDGIVVLDPDGNTTLCNRLAHEFLGSEDALPLLRSADPGCTLEALARGGPQREVTLSNGADTRVLGVTPRDIRTADGDLASVIVTLQDLTRRRREDRLKRDFLSLISHKFRTPLTALICGLEIMQTADAEDREVFLTEVSQRTRDLRVLVDRLLYFAELLEGSWSKSGTTDLHAMEEELRRQFRPQKGAPPIEIVWDLGEGAIVVPVPASRLRVALINLVDNALKFGSPAAPWVRIGSRRAADGTITVEVEDRGPGIPTQERELLFSSFHQLDEDFTGSVAGAGIGLAIVREITSQLGGTLELRDATPSGCIFVLSFAAAAAVPPTTEAHA